MADHAHNRGLAALRLALVVLDAHEGAAVPLAAMGPLERGYAAQIAGVQAGEDTWLLAADMMAVLANHQGGRPM
jgi:hypothetical protein